MDTKENSVENLIKKCKYCGKEFRSTLKNRVYCSKECFDGSVKDRQKKYFNNNRAEIYKRKITCKYCGNKFREEDLKERCCGGESCVAKQKIEKRIQAQKRYYVKHIKKTTKKYKKSVYESKRKYDQSHSEEHNIRNKSRKREKREWVHSLKKGKKCSKCGEERWFCLEYHHIDPSNKKFTIAECVSGSYGKETIQQEIEKCVLLCGNCHEHLNYLQRNIEGWKPTTEWFNNKEIYR